DDDEALSVGEHAQVEQRAIERGQLRAQGRDRFADAACGDAALGELARGAGRDEIGERIARARRLDAVLDVAVRRTDEADLRPVAHTALRHADDLGDVAAREPAHGASPSRSKSTSTRSPSTRKRGADARNGMVEESRERAASRTRATIARRASGSAA